MTPCSKTRKAPLTLPRRLPLPALAVLESPPVAERALSPASRLLLLGLAVLAVSCGPGGQEPGSTAAPGPASGDGDWARYVDPMIGTEGPGNVVPGPSLPHAMVKLSPDTNAEPGSVDAYEYAHDRIQGFSHTHLEGPGGGSNGYSNLLFLPTTGPLRTATEQAASSFTHDRESAAPGYYAVELLDYGVLAELTSTMRCGFHRYTFPGSAEAHVLIDLGHTRGLSLDGRIEVLGDRAVRGCGVYCMHPLVALATLGDPGTTGTIRLYFHAEFDRPFSSFGTWRGRRTSPGSRLAEGAGIGAYLDFGAEPGPPVQVKVGLSYIDQEQARDNLEREIPGWGFEAVRHEAERAWNALLGRVEVEGGSETDRVKFYTGLYHALLQPTDYTEYGRFWSGADGVGEVFEAAGRRFFSDDWALWDTFRTTHPLQTIVEPEARSDMVHSCLHLYRQGGWLDKCSWQATGYSRVMIGNHTVSLILDAYRKGFRDFDADLALEAMLKSATQDNPNILSESFCGYLNLGTPPDYRSLGYVPLECDPTQAVSMTLEYAYDDWCVGMMAGELGHTAERDAFLDRSRNYARHWNPAVGFMQARSRLGDWVWPFDPTAPTGFCEADSWKYTWFVPHDPQGLVRLMGGAPASLAKLDAFFDGGHYDPSNEPDFHVPFFYLYAGAPHRAQRRVRDLLESAFTALPSGLPGNDDSGATSAWYVLGAMGLYPVCPGDPVYALTSPLFDRITIRPEPELHPEKVFVVEARNNAGDHVFIQSAELNGWPLDRAWLRHEELARGGRLVLDLGPLPSDWGSESKAGR